MLEVLYSHGHTHKDTHEEIKIIKVNECFKNIVKFYSTHFFNPEEKYCFILVCGVF